MRKGKHFGKRTLAKTMAAFMAIALATALAPSPFFGGQVSGAEGTAAEPALRVMVAIDRCSTMKGYDDSLLTDFVAMLADACDSRNTEMGFFTFSDRIYDEYPIAPLKDAAARNRLKEKLSGFTRAGNTDVGLALRHGMEALREGKPEGARTALILLSDGKTLMNGSVPGRTLAGSQADVDSACEAAKADNCPIYTVEVRGIDAKSRQLLESISAATGAGLTRSLKNSSELFPLFVDLFTKITGMELQYRDAAVANRDGAREIDIPIAGSAETNIILPASAVITDAGSAAEIFSSKHYASEKLGPVGQGTLSVSVKTSEESVRLMYAEYGSVRLYLSPLDEDDLSKSEWTYAAFFADDQGKPLTGSEIYGGLTAGLVITAPTGDSVTVPMENSGDGFSVTYKNQNPGEYSAYIEVSGKSYSGASNSIAWVAAVMNPAPAGNFPDHIKGGISFLPGGGKDYRFRLDDYFKNPDGGPLSYTLTEGNDAAEITGDGWLVIKPTDEKTLTIGIAVTNDSGGKYTGIYNVTVEPLWIYYRTWVIAAICLLIGLLLAYFLLFRRYAAKNRKLAEDTGTEPPEAAPPPFEAAMGRRFYGCRMEGYFLSTRSGAEIPVMNWSAAYIDNKGMITLGELLDMMEVDEQLPEARKIFLEAGSGGELIFHHRTNCAVAFCGKPVPAGKRETLQYDERLYIVFEDKVTELELRYKRARRSITPNVG